MKKNVNFARPSEEVRKTASDWVARRDAGLSAAEESEFQAWREGSPDHRAALSRYESLWSDLDQPRASGVAMAFNRDLDLMRRRDRRRRARLMKTVSIVVVMLGTVWVGSRQAGNRSHALETSVSIIVPKSEVLTDGSIIEYPSGSIFAVDFSSPDFRRVNLSRGEAHFQVAKNPARPFIVRAAGVDIRAVGTAFSVQLAASAVEVLVTEGQVAVNKSHPESSALPDPETNSHLSAFVGVGQKVVVTLRSELGGPPPMIEQVTREEADQRLAWRSPRMEFSNAPLREAVAAINRYGMERGGVTFTIGDPELELARLSGIFRVDDETAFVAILEKGFGIQADRISEHSLVLCKRH